MQTAALYIRVSTHYQEELSPDAQKRLLLEYAKEHDYIVDEKYIYIEGGISGRKADKRPEFINMIATAKSKEHPFDAILVWKFSRFARNQEESIVYKSLLNKNKVEVISISEPLVDGPFGSLIERIIEWMDEYYSIRLSGEVLRGMKENALRGNFQASPAYGLALAHKGATPHIVDTEAVVIRIMSDLFIIDRLSVLEITLRINDMGYRTRRGNKFEKRNVEYILKNPIYYGYIRWNMRDQTQSTQRIKDESEWIIVESTVPNILPKERYEQTMQRFKNEYKPRNAKPITHKKHWLSGMLKCSSCGRSLSVSQTVDKRYGHLYVNFQCYGYLKGKCSTSHGVSEKRIVPSILNSIKDVIESDFVDFEVIRNTPISEDSELDILEHQLERISLKEDRAKDAYLNEIDTLAEYKKNKMKLSDERKALILKINSIKHDNAPVDMKEYLNTVSNVYDILNDDNVSWEEKHKAIHTIIKQITFHSDTKTIDIEYIYTGSPIK